MKCRFERGQPNGRRSLAYIDEIRVILSKNLSKNSEKDGWLGSFVPVSDVGFRSNSGCPKGKGFLPAGYTDERG